MGNALAWPHRMVETVTDPSDFESDLCIRGEYRFEYRVLRVSSSNVANTFAAVLLAIRDGTRTAPHAYAAAGRLLRLDHRYRRRPRRRRTVHHQCAPLREVGHAAIDIVIRLAIWSLLSGSGHRSLPAASSRDLTNRTPSSGAAPDPLMLGHPRLAHLASREVR